MADTESSKDPRMLALEEIASIHRYTNADLEVLGKILAFSKETDVAYFRRSHSYSGSINERWYEVGVKRSDLLENVEKLLIKHGLTTPITQDFKEGRVRYYFSDPQGTSDKSFCLLVERI